MSGDLLLVLVKAINRLAENVVDIVLGGLVDYAHQVSPTWGFAAYTVNPTFPEG